MFILEGNIGAGKSTFLALLERHLPSVSVAFEPLNNWQGQVFGQSLLANFYQDPKRWAFTLETLAMMCRVKDHLQEQADGIVSTNRVVERSIYSGHYVFGHNSYTSGFMTQLEWQMYHDWFNMLIPGKCLPPQGFIYLKVSPTIAFERIKKRNRYAEKTLALDYLKSIDQRHEEFLITKIGVLPELKKIPVLVLDCNEEFETNSVMLQRHLDAVQEFMHTVQVSPRPSFGQRLNIL